jgi:hypothetical protein
MSPGGDWRGHLEGPPLDGTPGGNPMEDVPWSGPTGWETLERKPYRGPTGGDPMHGPLERITCREHPEGDMERSPYNLLRGP